jgi:cobalt-zinc-cadmium efflux system outer membrane protein
MSKEKRKPFLSGLAHLACSLAMALTVPAAQAQTGRNVNDATTTVSSLPQAFDAAWQRQPEAKSAELRREAADAPATNRRELDGGIAVARTVVEDRSPQSQRRQP